MKPGESSPSFCVRNVEEYSDYSDASKKIPSPILFNGLAEMDMFRNVGALSNQPFIPPMQLSPMYHSSGISGDVLHGIFPALNTSSVAQNLLGMLPTASRCAMFSPPHHGALMPGPDNWMPSDPSNKIPAHRGPFFEPSLLALPALSLAPMYSTPIGSSMDSTTAAAWMRLLMGSFPPQFMPAAANAHATLE
jgi:hypothetical protein